MKKKIIYLAISIAIGLYYSGCTKEENKECNKNHEKTPAHQTANREGCEYCNAETSHSISFDDAAQLIYNFYNVYGPGSDFEISNIGGTLILDQPTTPLDPSADGDFYNLKIHFCLDQIESNNVLFIAADLSKECFFDKESNSYSTDESIGSNDYFSSLRANDIPMFKVSTSVNDIKTHLTSYTDLNDNNVRQLTAMQVTTFNEIFRAHLNSIHPCIAAYFNKAMSIDIISNDVNTNIYRYYFGFDPELENNKLRIILVGVDPESKENVCTMDEASKMFDQSWPPS